MLCVICIDHITIPKQSTKLMPLNFARGETKERLSELDLTAGEACNTLKVQAGVSKMGLAHSENYTHQTEECVLRDVCGMQKPLLFPLFDTF